MNFKKTVICSAPVTAEASAASGGLPTIKILATGGTIAGECRAVPWCRGGYALFSLEEDFSAVAAENTVVSAGGGNLPRVAAALFSLGNAAEEVSEWFSRISEIDLTSLNALLYHKFVKKPMHQGKDRY